MLVRSVCECGCGCVCGFVLIMGEWVVSEWTEWRVAARNREKRWTDASIVRVCRDLVTDASVREIDWTYYIASTDSANNRSDRTIVLVFNMYLFTASAGSGGPGVQKYGRTYVWT